jgi:GNAT superfamily N-acetyltransferase
LIEPLRERDWEDWSELWRGYLHFYRHSLEEQTTRTTFKRLCDRTDGMFGVIARDERGQALGLAHAVVHPSTWSVRGYCYLEDLFLAPEARGKGTARELIQAVYAQADELGCTRVYWHTQEFNGPARSLYDQLAHRTSFILYER